MSIRFRMTFWFTAALCLMAALIFFALRTAVRLNLRSTVRGYLIGMVEENVSKISYSESRADAGDEPVDTPLVERTLQAQHAHRPHGRRSDDANKHSLDEYF